MFFIVFGAECAAVIQFARDFKGSAPLTLKPNLTNLSPTNCCNKEGITCVSNTIREIDWGGPVEWEYGRNDGFINGTALLQMTQLERLVLEWNSLHGQIPILPSTLIELRLTVNRLTGTLPLLHSGLQFLDVAVNQLVGNVTLPVSLQGFTAHDNMFTGVLDLRANTLIYLYIFTNLFTGLLMTGNGPAGQCGIFSNPMTYDSIKQFTECTRGNDARALGWTAPSNYMQIECDNLVDFLAQLKGSSAPEQYPNITAIRNNCCSKAAEAEGVNCASNKRIVWINWGGRGFDGYLNSTLLNTFSTLYGLDLSGNQLWNAFEVKIDLVYLDILYCNVGPEETNHRSFDVFEVSQSMGLIWLSGRTCFC